MTTKTFDLCRRCQIDCGETLHVDIHICVPVAILANPPADFDFGFVTAQIEAVRQSVSTDPCGGCGWVYTISYDDAQLLPSIELSNANVNGVVCGCAADFALQAPKLSAVVVDTDSVNLSYDVGTGELTADVIVSSTSGNQLSIIADGLFVPAALFQSVLDTSSIDISLAAGVLSGAVKISATAGNQISIAGDGLLVPTAKAAWTDFKASAVVSSNTGTLTGVIIDEAKYRNYAGITHIKFSMRGTLTGGPSGAIRLDPPVPGIADDAQASYICQGVVNGVGTLLNWRYDAGLNKLIFFTDSLAIANGVFEAHLSDFYETA